MIDLEKVNSSKEKILATISTNGPSLPVHLAQASQLSPLFASAFLSELYSEGKVKISNLKIGSSPLYYLPGQEKMLEKFAENLNSREKEALYLLKKEQLLDDESQTPVVRVAIRAIKDFALPIKIKVDEREKLFWKYAFGEESKINQIINKLTKKDKKHQEEQLLIPTVKIKEQEKNDEIKEETEIIKDKPKRKIKAKNVESKFTVNLKEYLLAKEIEVLELIEQKKKEISAKVRIDTIFGKQEYYLIAKEKKKISETDLALALQKAQHEKMPALIMSSGDLDKKTQDFQKLWKNLIKFEKLNF